MGYEWSIGFRYLKAKRKQTFISLITWISIGGVALGVMALIIVLGVMSGFERDLRRKILGANSHIVLFRGDDAQIKGYDKIIEELRLVDGVLSASPFIMSQTMLTTEKSATGVLLRGIDVEAELRVTDLGKNMVSGSLDALQGEGLAADGIILGSVLARILKANLTSVVTAVSPYGTIAPGGLVPSAKKFRVAGIFESGMYDYDSSLAFISLASAQRFFGLDDSVSGLEVKLDDIYAAPRVARAIEARLGYPYVARTWMELNKNLFSALKLEKIVMFIILILVVVVAAFNIISTLIMMVMERGRDIAILKSMGATNRAIMKIFMIEGFVIGLAGTAIGASLGYILGKLLQTYKFIKLPSDIYILDKLPIELSFFIFALVSISALAISFLVTIYPAWNASRLNPAEALRYE